MYAGGKTHCINLSITFTVCAT